MTYFLKQGSSFLPTPEANLDIHTVLPVGNYIVKKNPQTGQLYFDSIESFDESAKIYGKIPKQADKILNTFYDRSASTGVMLTGEKGSGKTLLARLLSCGAAVQGIPTIIINAPWCGDEFNKLIQDITQPAVVLFDEFEKVYDRDEQERMLTLLDGVYQSKKLFIITCNDKYRVDVHMRNRPGRIFYMIDFKGLEADFITEYCEEKLNNKTHIPTICKIAGVFTAFNFDILKALVEEMNRYNESPHEALEMLNATPFNSDDDVQYKVQLIIDGTVLNDSVIGPTMIYSNPMSQSRIEIQYYAESVDSGLSIVDNSHEIYDEWDAVPKSYLGTVSVPKSSGDRSYVCRPDNLTHIDTSGKTYTFSPESNVQVLFTRIIGQVPDFMKAIGL